MQSSASQTARLVAAYRARASVRSPPLCSDPWAAALAGEEGAALARLYDQVNPHMDLMIGVRTSFLDARVRQHTAGADGFHQVVILGAGLDTRAARLGRPGVRFFEVDHPATQADKLQRLHRLEGYPVEGATYVPCDFEQDDFLDRLVEAGFSCLQPALVLWEGVTYYLSEDVVRATLRRLASGCEGHSAVIFDYGTCVLGEEATSDATSRRIRAALAEMGEPLKFWLDDPLPLLYEEGFRHVRTVSFDQACLSLTGTYDPAHQFNRRWFGLCSRIAPDDSIE